MDVTKINEKLSDRWGAAKKGAKASQHGNDERPKRPKAKQCRRCYLFGMRLKSVCPVMERKVSKNQKAKVYWKNGAYETCFKTEEEFKALIEVEEARKLEETDKDEQSQSNS